MDGAFEKVLAKVLDPGMPLRLLPPYQSATDAAYAEFVRRMSVRLPHWMPKPTA